MADVSNFMLHMFVGPCPLSTELYCGTFMRTTLHIHLTVLGVLRALHGMIFIYVLSPIKITRRLLQLATNYF